jgi:flagellin
MAFRIATNVSSLNTQRWLGVAGAGQSKALERLSSGYKINSAKDDAAGIAVATKLQVKSVSMAKSIDNGNQGLAMLQTAESGIDQISNILTRLKELATQSASANTPVADRAALDTERSNLEAEINKIAQNTKYGSTQLLKGGTSLNATMGASLTPSFGVSNIDLSGAAITSDTGYSMTIDVTGTSVAVSITKLGTVGSSATTTITAPSSFSTATADFSAFGIKVTVNASIADITTGTLAVGGFTATVGTSSFSFQLGDQNQSYDQISSSIVDFQTTAVTLNLTGDISSATNARTYLTTIDSAVGNLTSERGKLGAAMNQINYHVANLESMNENTKAATSTIKDADFAAEMAEFTKYQIIQQSGIAMLSQANQLPQQVLSLLK